MKRSRSVICSKFRMAWILVLFDLPVGSREERKAAANFRKDLIRNGYFMVQFSVYARPCASDERLNTQIRRLKKNIPPKGEVRGLFITDAQWGRMIIVKSSKPEHPENMPEQLMFF